MEHFARVLQCFPAELLRQMTALQAGLDAQVEEIRVYRDRPVQLLAGGRRLSTRAVLRGSDLEDLLHNLMKFSYYAYEEELARGYITIDGGHRVGVCGRAVLEQGRVVLLRDVSSLNIRCSREIPGCAEPLRPYLGGENGTLRNLLIVSPPGCGKTTLLRDVARILGQQGRKVAICDERSEIAGMHGGVSAYTFGPMTDVLDGCPKAEGMQMLLRAMSPEVILTDEIGRAADAAAIQSCRNSGVAVIASAHGDSMEDLGRLEIRSLLDEGIFDTLVFLSRTPRPGTIRQVVCHA